MMILLLITITIISLCLNHQCVFSIICALLSRFNKNTNGVFGFKLDTHKINCAMLKSILVNNCDVSFPTSRINSCL